MFKGFFSEDVVLDDVVQDEILSDDDALSDDEFDAMYSTLLQVSPPSSLVDDLFSAIKRLPPASWPTMLAENEALVRPLGDACN